MVSAPILYSCVRFDVAAAQHNVLPISNYCCIANVDLRPFVLKVSTRYGSKLAYRAIGIDPSHKAQNMLEFK